MRCTSHKFYRQYYAVHLDAIVPGTGTGAHAGGTAPSGAGTGSVCAGAVASPSSQGEGVGNGTGEVPAPLKWLRSNQPYVPATERALVKSRPHILTESQVGRLDELLDEHSGSFSTGPWDLGRLKSVYGIEHVIRPMPGAVPAVRKMPQWSYKEIQWMKADVQAALDAGVIERADDDSWAADVRYAPKPDGSRRFCVAFHHNNKVFLMETYPLPSLEDCLNGMRRPRYFTSIDLVQAFFQVPVEKSSRKYLAFRTPFGIDR